MQLDKKAVDKLLTMNDAQLGAVIQKVVREAGIDLADFGASAGDIQSIRRALTGVTDADLERISEQYNEYKRRPRKRQ